MYDFVGTQIHNIMSKEVAKMSLPIFKKYITHWLLHEYDAIIMKYYDCFFFFFVCLFFFSLFLRIVCLFIFSVQIYIIEFLFSIFICVFVE
jgi:hypothetical protein